MDNKLVMYSCSFLAIYIGARLWALIYIPDIKLHVMTNLHQAYCLISFSFANVVYILFSLDWCTVYNFGCILTGLIKFMAFGQYSFCKDSIDDISNVPFFINLHSMFCSKQAYRHDQIENVVVTDCEVNISPLWTTYHDLQIDLVMHGSPVPQK